MRASGILLSVCYNVSIMIENFANTISVSSGIGFVFAFILCIFLIAALIVGIIVLKGYALWCAAKRDEKGWFIALLIVNTMGILELIYLYFFAGKLGGKSSSVPPSKPPLQ